MGEILLFEKLSHRRHSWSFLYTFFNQLTNINVIKCELLGVFQ